MPNRPSPRLPDRGASAEAARDLRCTSHMELDAIHAAEAARFIKAQLAAVDARIRASRARPLDRAVLNELTALRFSATRLSRRLRLLPPASLASRCRVDALDPLRVLEFELQDARAEARRRGARVSLRLSDLGRVSRKISFIDALASLVEDGIEAGANYLTLETRHHSDHLELGLITDTPLDRASFCLSMLGTKGRASRAAAGQPYAIELEQVAGGLTRISVSALHTAPVPRRTQRAKQWPDPSPSRV